jgi:membrane fusion protein, copper/silver efflux system
MKHVRLYKYIWPILGLLIVTGFACQQQNTTSHAGHEEAAKEEYTCPMHPEIIRNEPGSCPICGMDLVMKEKGGTAIADISMEALLKPTNEFVVSAVQVTTMKQQELPVEVEAVGTIAYDTRQTGTISSRIAGRIERLYVRYRFQEVKKGQRIMDVYSPELMTAQQNLLFILKNDPTNVTLIDAARHRLLLLGMSESQVQQVVRTGKPLFSVAVYSNYSGHIHETTTLDPIAATSPSAGATMAATPPSTTQELSLKEGMYLQKGQSVFTVYNPSRLWVLLNIYNENNRLVKVGNAVRITPETAPGQNFRAQIDFIEPFFRPENKTFTARVYFTNRGMHLPVGSQVRATIFASDVSAYWIPKEAVLSLGIDKIVFLKEGGGFRAHKVEMGMQKNNMAQVISGLSRTDSIAQNAQYLIDNESFIKVAER